MNTPSRQRSLRRVLLALEGRDLNRKLQDAAVRICIDLRAPLDIMVTQTEEEGASLPALLMLRLEHSGMDYRFAQVNNPLSFQIRRYISRGKAPCTVIVSEAQRLDPACLEEIKVGQHQLIDLSRLPASDRKDINQDIPQPIQWLHT